MANTCPIGIDVERLRDRVRTTYERVALTPSGAFHFHTGADYAIEFLRYPREELDALPDACTARFAGVGNPHRLGTIGAGAVVLDHACGAGMDLLLAARRVGSHGRAIGVDLTPAMRAAARTAARLAGLESIVEIREGTFEDLPVEDASVDYVLSNGVLNLAPDKERVLAEIARVLRPGGELLLADVVLERELAPSTRRNPDLSAACVGGALTEERLGALAAQAGLVDCTLVERFDCFRNTVLERKFRGRLRVQGANFRARKPSFTNSGSR